MKEDPKTKMWQIPSKACKDTKLKPLVFVISGLTFTIPKEAYTRDTEGKNCEILLKNQDPDYNG